MTTRMSYVYIKLTSFALLLQYTALTFHAIEFEVVCLSSERLSTLLEIICSLIIY